jgi:hypothetical protein
LPDSCDRTFWRKPLIFHLDLIFRVGSFCPFRQRNRLLRQRYRRDQHLTLSAAQTKGALKAELKRYLSPAILVLDEVGYLPIDQRGADLLFQVISQRYERGSIILTSNKAFKQWPAIFNGDSTITSAVLDRPASSC